jgi:hypothetical protein
LPGFQPTSSRRLSRSPPSMPTLNTILRKCFKSPNPAVNV